MTTPHPINDPFDADLHQLFAPTHPDAGFEDRLITTLRQRQRLTIPPQVTKAAVAAAAVVVVGMIGYVGNQKLMNAVSHDSEKVASATLPTGGIKADEFDFGGGSNPAQNWNDFKSDRSNKTTSYTDPFASFGKSNASQLKTPAAGDLHAVASDINDRPLRELLRASNPTGNVSGLNYFHGIAIDSKNESGNVQAGKAPSHPKDGQNVLYDDGRAEWMNNPFTGTQHDNIYTGEGSSTKRMIEPAKTITIESDSGSNAAIQGQSATPSPVTPTAPGPAVAPVDAAASPADHSDAPASNPTSQPTDDRKIIRTGAMEFEVDRFDTAQTQITKIVAELGGFVGATDSEKLPNGKVRGSISVKVPPERLDTLVLSLRALGDLKNQQISAMDITKEYTDLQSELTADRAMQERLLDLIHNAKGSVKDLLAAENELGIWRGKIEKAEGAIRYYNAQVALSTLTITLSERDLQTPAGATQTETADMGLESQDVEKSRDLATKAIEDGRGRIVGSNLKRLDAGQLAASIVADVPPDSAGAVIDQIRQLGKITRLEINRQQTSTDGSSAVTASTPLKTDRKPTRLLISIYNLANVAPRRTTNVSLAADNVESAYNTLTNLAKSSGGRVVTSNLDRVSGGDPTKATGSLVLEVPPEKLESALSALHAQGEVLKLSVTENTDTQNSTEAKQGLTVNLVALAAVPARETVQQSLAANDVPGAYQSILSAAGTTHVFVQSSQLNEQDRQNITAELQLDVPRAQLDEFEKSIAAVGGTLSRNSVRAGQAEGTVDSKIGLNLSITSSDHLAPRETTQLQVEVSDADTSAAAAGAMAITAGGRVIQMTASNDHGKGTAKIAIDLPLDKTADVLQQIRQQGTVHGIDSSRDPQAPAGAMAHGQIDIEYATPDAIVADPTGPWASVRQGLVTSVTGLMWSLQWVVVGICLVGPWAGLGWIGWKIWGGRARRGGGLK